jgi:hypothetical protein
MKAVLINPPHAGSYRSAIMRGDSLALAVLAQALRGQRFATVLCDAFLRGLSEEEVVAALGSGIDLACITLMHETSWPAAQRIAARLRSTSPDVTILLGGSGPTLNPALYLADESEIDVVYAGASLQRLPEAIGSRRGSRRLFDAGRCTQADMEVLTERPDLAFSYAIDRIVAMETSQGCYARCDFCSIHAHYGQNWVAKDAATVLQEVELVTEFRFVDANFFGIPRDKSDRRARAIAEGMNARGLRFRLEGRANDVSDALFSDLVAGGLGGIFLGLESGSDRVLKGLRKDCTVRQNLEAVETLRRLLCGFSFGFMMLHEDVDEEDIDSNVEFLKHVEHGVRIKHLFGGLIHQEGTKLGRRTVSVLDSNRSLFSRLGYVPKNQLAVHLGWVWDTLVQDHKSLLEKEHVLGIILERGKETRDERYWRLDASYGGACLSWYEDVLLRLKSNAGSPLAVAQAAHALADEIEPIVHGILSRATKLGLAECVMLEDVRPLLDAAGEAA